MTTPNFRFKNKQPLNKLLPISNPPPSTHISHCASPPFSSFPPTLHFTPSHHPYTSPSASSTPTASPTPPPSQSSTSPAPPARATPTPTVSPSLHTAIGTLLPAFPGPATPPPPRNTRSSRSPSALPAFYPFHRPAIAHEETAIKTARESLH